MRRVVVIQILAGRRDLRVQMDEETKTGIANEMVDAKRTVKGTMKGGGVTQTTEKGDETVIMEMIATIENAGRRRTTMTTVIETGKIDIKTTTDGGTGTEIETVPGTKTMIEDASLVSGAVSTVHPIAILDLAILLTARTFMYPIFLM